MRSPLNRTIWAAIAVFVTYLCMYAYRKPLSAATYEGLELWGYSYKIIIVVTQVLGYLTSKFLGIKIISELDNSKRIFLLLGLIGTSLLALLLFAITPYPYNFVWVFFNGLPLGLIWGIVFSFVEGRKQTDFLATFLSISFIVSSGFVKSIGRYLIESFGVSDFWMPFAVGTVFIPFLLISAWMLSKIPPPDEADKLLRTERTPLNSESRKKLFGAFAIGFIAILAANMVMTIGRDIKDNFLVEIFQSIKIDANVSIYTKTETIVGISVLILLSFMVLIKSNVKAFFTIHAVMIAGFMGIVVSTYLYTTGILSPFVWVITQGISLYSGYIIFQSLYFERFIASFKVRGNVGFLIYVSDFIGYLGSCAILIIKEFYGFKANWEYFFIYLNYFVGASGIVAVLISWIYFSRKIKEPKENYATV